MGNISTLATSISNKRTGELVDISDGYDQSHGTIDRLVVYKDPATGHYFFAYPFAVYRNGSQVLDDCRRGVYPTLYFETDQSHGEKMLEDIKSDPPHLRKLLTGSPFGHIMIKAAARPEPAGGVVVAVQKVGNTPNRLFSKHEFDLTYRPYQKHP